MGGHGFSPRFCPEAPVLGRALLSTRDLRRAAVKRGEEAMEILEAYDRRARCVARRRWRGVITRRSRGWSPRGRRRVAGCRSGRAVGRWSTRSRRRSMSWSIARARWCGLIRCTGCWSRWGMRGRIARRGGRSRRRSAAGGNKHGRRTRPWIPQPGLWLQWDYGDGPEVAGTRAVLFCAWLAWSRFRVVVPLRDKTLPSVVIGLGPDAAARGRGSDVCADGQREDGDGRACVRDRGPQRDDR